MTWRAFVVALLAAGLVVGVSWAGLVLTHFEAAWQGNVVRLTWGVASQIEVAGFRLYRSSAPLEPDQVASRAEPLTPEPIFPDGACVATTGAEFEYSDTTANTTTPVYYYWVAVIDCQGGVSIERENLRTVTRGGYAVYLPLVTRMVQP
jgi:hypothetical protein